MIKLSIYLIEQRNIIIVIVRQYECDPRLTMGEHLQEARTEEKNTRPHLG